MDDQKTESGTNRTKTMNEKRRHRRTDRKIKREETQRGDETEGKKEMNEVMEGRKEEEEEEEEGE